MKATELVLLAEAREATTTGAAIRLREAAHLTQGELARAIEVTPACISRWESGSRRPSGPAAIRYAHLLRMLSRDVAVAA